MARSPYRIARQEHLGDMLDELQKLGLLTWNWDYENSTSIYWVTETGKPRRKLEIRKAEQVAARLCSQAGIVWLPVPHPGGETQLSETRRQIDSLRGGHPTAHASTRPRFRAVEAEPFDLSAYPHLERRLGDKPAADRSAQVYGMVRLCMDSGLSDGQIKWLLFRYQPFAAKYATRDREGDRVIARARDDGSR